MLSAIVSLPPLRHDASPSRPAERMVRTLGSLVPAGVAGLLRDVVIAGPPGLDLRHVADHAGCAFCEAADEAACLRAALAAVRQPQVLVLQAGFAVGADFVEELADLLGAAVPRVTRLRATPERLRERLFPALAPVVGLLAPVARLQAAGGGRFRAIVAGTGRGSTFAARARRVL